LKSQSDFHNLKDVWQDMAFRVNFLIGCGSFSLVESSVFVSLDLFQQHYGIRFWTMVLSGVPQGSVVGPVLFLCYINDMTEIITSMYADDTQLFRRINNDSDRAALQKDLDQLSAWSKHWQLCFNGDKCKIMHIVG